jgi:hypothetical protein
MSLFTIDIEQVTHQVGMLGLPLVGTKMHLGAGISIFQVGKVIISSIV